MEQEQSNMTKTDGMQENTNDNFVMEGQVYQSILGMNELIMVEEQVLLALKDKAKSLVGKPCSNSVERLELMARINVQEIFVDSLKKRLSYIIDKLEGYSKVIQGGNRRKVFIDYYIKGMPIEEIMNDLGYENKWTVYHMLSHIKKLFKEKGILSPSCEENTDDLSEQLR